MPRNFVCRCCGREIFDFAGDPADSDKRCVHCQQLPGWIDDPDLRALLAPGESFAGPDRAVGAGRARSVTPLEAKRA